MEKDYNWTQDGEIVERIHDEVWITFGNKYNFNIEKKTIESGKLRSIHLNKNDFKIGVFMGRLWPFELHFYSNTKCTKTLNIFDLLRKANPPGSKLSVLYKKHDLPNPEEIIHKELRWTQWMSNYVFLLEKYCSDLLETGDICGWLEKHK